MKRIVFLAASWLLAQAMIAQQNLPPFFIIKTDSASFCHIRSPYLQLLADPQERYSLEQVMKSPASAFFRAAEESSGKKRYDTYWVRFRIRNTLSHEVTVYFPTEHDRLDQYSFEGSKVLHHKTGYSVGWQKRDGHKFLRALPLQLKVNEEKLVYQRWHDALPFLKRDIDKVTFRMGDDVLKESSTNSLIPHPWSTFIIPFILGVLLIGFLYHMLNYFLVKDKAFLYFALWLFFYFILQVFIEYELNNPLLRHLIPVYLGEYTNEYFWNVFWRIGLSMFLVFQTLFVCHLLKLKQTSLSHYRVLIGLVLLQVVVNISSYVLALYMPALSLEALRFSPFFSCQYNKCLPRNNDHHAAEKITDGRFPCPDHCTLSAHVDSLTICLECYR